MNDDMEDLIKKDTNFDPLAVILSKFFVLSPFHFYQCLSRAEIPVLPPWGTGENVGCRPRDWWHCSVALTSHNVPGSPPQGGATGVGQAYSWVHLPWKTLLVFSVLTCVVTVLNQKPGTFQFSTFLRHRASVPRAFLQLSLVLKCSLTF